MKTKNRNIVRFDDKYYISAISSYTDDRVRVLNHVDTFGVFDRWGDIQPIGKKVQGLYFEGTRFLSDFEMRINGLRPILLSSNIKEENEILSVDLTNPLFDENGATTNQETIHISRHKFVRDNKCYEEITLTNFGLTRQKFELSFNVDADFSDIFEVRGTKRKKRGSKLTTTYTPDSIKLGYRGLDKIGRYTNIEFHPEPSRVKNNQVLYKISLDPKEVFRIKNNITFEIEGRKENKLKHNEAESKILSGLKKTNDEIGEIISSNEQFNHWINRSQADLVSLLADTKYGKYPYAGVPWYNTAFGRDGIITALETLWIAPFIARGVLKYLAATQASTENPECDAEPGKILHETRGGEMVALNEIPFGLYYGTIDATPLFIVLAGEYYKRTADRSTLIEIWPNIKKALKWIDEYGDLDQDGYVEYIHKAENGLTNQGWKDSHDSVFYENGQLASPPIALCEVQGYVYQAKKWAAYLADLFGEHELAKTLKSQSVILKKKFNKDFWDSENNTFVLALDGDKKPCKVKSSNPGHCLFSGIVDDKHAKGLSRTLLSDKMFSGWGVRTLASDEVRYNPMSYHNGSVWPHDTVLIANGLAKYGFTKEADKLVKALFDASLFIEFQRLPELYCGFKRRLGEGPTAYPVACSPQAWSVGAVFMGIQSFLRIEIDSVNKEVNFYNPGLPDFINELTLKNLCVGEGKIHLQLFAHKNDISINIIEKPAGWKVVAIKE